MSILNVVIRRQGLTESERGGGFTLVGTARVQKPGAA